jgi:hypothetical protein
VKSLSIWNAQNIFLSLFACDALRHPCVTANALKSRYKGIYLNITEYTKLFLVVCSKHVNGIEEVLSGVRVTD